MLKKYFKKCWSCIYKNVNQAFATNVEEVFKKNVEQVFEKNVEQVFENVKKLFENMLIIHIKMLNKWLINGEQVFEKFRTSIWKNVYHVYKNVEWKKKRKKEK